MDVADKRVLLTARGGNATNKATANAANINGGPRGASASTLASGTLMVRDAEAEGIARVYRHFLMSFGTEPSSSQSQSQKNPNANPLEEQLSAHSKAKYIKLLRSLQEAERHTLFVSMKDVSSYDQNLADVITTKYHHLLPYLVRTITTLVITVASLQYTNQEDGNTDIPQVIEDVKSKTFFLSLYDVPIRHKMRNLKCKQLGQLLKVTGQVVRTHSVHPELIVGTFVCNDCSTEIPNIVQQFRYTEPSMCRNNLCNNRINFTLVIENSKFVDFQKIRIQETQGELPRGARPRSLDVFIRGHDQVECIQPGDRIDFIGTYVVMPDMANVIPGNVGVLSKFNQAQGNQETSLAGLKSMGVKEMSHRTAFFASSCVREGSNLPIQMEALASSSTFMDIDEDHENQDPMNVDDDQDENESTGEKRFSVKELKQIKKMASDPDIYRNLARSLFPMIYGNESIKKGILLQLFGGVPKKTKEGTSLRGDINICIVGDPSTAKSCFLKAVCDFAPSRAIYTSGKASTASGLTASVMKDEEGGFVIEAGALMLADQGICCIDEFDKMDLKDQVAIHEAMEQQTISITKAGVKATLNSRCSILSAANPIHGNYDRTKSLRNNLTLSLPIMSRFDLFFVLVDECEESMDTAIAQRIVDSHADAEMFNDKLFGPYNTDDIRLYIKFCRGFNPKLGEDAKKLLVETYQGLRVGGIEGTASSLFGNNNGNRKGAGSGWRITVRQLESLVRLSEAYAKLHCSSVVTEAHVKEASSLLTKSIMRVEHPEVDLIIQQPTQEYAPFNNDQEDATRDTETRVEHKKLRYEDYKKISFRLVNKIISMDEQAEDSANGGNDMKKSDYVNWYIQTYSIEEASEDGESSQRISTSESLLEEQALIGKIIDRLIHVDNVLVPLKSTQEIEENGDDLDPGLAVHPNYDNEDHYNHAIFSIKNWSNATNIIIYNITRKL